MDLQRIFTKVKLGLKRKAPQIMIYGGLTAMVGGTVAACMETRKAEKIFEDHRERISKAETKKAKVKEYAKTGVKLIGVYWPSVTMIGTGIAGVVGGERIQHGRYLGAVTTAAALKAGNDELRRRIEENYGEDAANNLYNGTATVDNKGEKVENVIVDKPINPYARVFDYGECSAAEPNFDYNLMYAEQKQEALQTLFAAKKGFISMNDILAGEFGYEPTKNGQVDGYVWDGITKIDLGITVARKFNADGEYEEVVMLNPKYTPNALELAAKLGIVEDR